MPEEKSESAETRRRDGLLGILLKKARAFASKFDSSRKLAAEREEQIGKFKQYYIEFRKLLTANNDFLETINEIEEKLLNKQHLEIRELKRIALDTVIDISLMVNSIKVISGNRYPGLNESFRKISVELGALVDSRWGGTPEGMVLDMADVIDKYSGFVGGKMSNLCELRNSLGFPTPDGFAVTFKGCNQVLVECGVLPIIQSGVLEDLKTPEEITAAAHALQERIIKTAPPAALEKQIFSACDRLAARTGSEPRLAVRSSAQGEDSSYSFAGQFKTELNVPRGNLIKAFLNVLSSLFSPEVIEYRRLHEMSSQPDWMAVGFIEMIEPVASGIIFSNDPNKPDPGQVLIHVVWGLGVTLADGETSPEEIIVSRVPRLEVISRVSSTQRVALMCSAEAGCVATDLEDSSAMGAIITDEEALRLAESALALENHFGVPQDIEWAMNRDRRIVFLQSRQLRISHDAGIEDDLEGMPVLLSGGETACPGAGAGPAVHLNEDDDMDSFPEGGVLVAKRSSPKFVRIMNRASAIITDSGSTTGHMASLSREFKIPTLLNTKDATRVIPNGAEITVNATGKTVYSGIAPAAVKKRGEAVPNAAEIPAGYDLPTRETIEKVEKLIVPLNLTNPKSQDFTPENCRTLHDMARFIHEISYKEMFSLGLRLDDYRSVSYRLSGMLHMELYIIDLDDGVAPPPKGRKVCQDNITSVPLKSFLTGMLHPEVLACYKPIDAGGFFSLMMRHNYTNPESQDTFGYPSYAIVTKNYLNYTARMGYHFSVMDTYCGETPNNNYINLQFRGGAADKVRRRRRAHVIANILEANGISAKVDGDNVSARFTKATKEEIQKRLDIIGRLLQFIRQMDISMKTDGIATAIQESFLAGDYCLSRLTTGGKKVESREEDAPR